MQWTFPHLFQQQTYIQYLMMIITIVKYSEYIYVILVTQIKGIQVFFLIWTFISRFMSLSNFTKTSIFE